MLTQVLQYVLFKWETVPNWQKDTAVMSWAKGGWRKYDIAALIRSATNNQSWSLKIIAVSLCGTSQWRQSKQQRHCPVPPQPGPLWPRSGVEPEPCVCTGGRRGCWWLGPTGCPAETLQCHIPFPSPFCWRFATPGQTMSRRDAPWRGSERGEMTRCLPWNRLPPPVVRLPSYGMRWSRHSLSKAETDKI